MINSTTLKRLKRCDVNELERKLRLEKVVAGKQLRLAMETEEEEQDWRMMQLSNGSGSPDEERKARLEEMVATTRLRLALETEEERRAKKRFGLRLKFSTKKNSRNELARPVMGTIFLCYYLVKQL